jgi:hypothetical protein
MLLIICIGRDRNCDRVSTDYPVVSIRWYSSFWYSLLSDTTIKEEIEPVPMVRASFIYSAAASSFNGARQRCPASDMSSAPRRKAPPGHAP